MAQRGYQHGISTFGDLKYAKNFKNFDYVNPSAPKGGEIKFGVEGGFNNLNQFILKGISASGLSYLYDSLTTGSEDEISARYGLIASGVKLSKDKMMIEFKLRKNAYFHDGAPITADDVVFTFNKLISEGHPSYKMSFRDVKEVVKINQYLVRFYFKHNRNRDLPILVSSLPILPKHYYENLLFDKTTIDPPLGSGPYKIKEVNVNRSIIFERVANYWAKDLAVNVGRYNFDKITYDYYRDNNILVEAFKSQKYDFRRENIARNWANAYKIEAIDNGDIIKKEVMHELPAPMQSYVINLRKEKFENVALRKAISYAFDFEWLRDHIFYGAYQRTQSYFANSVFASTGFTLPKSDGKGFNRTNLIKAKDILDKAGYEVVDQKLIDPKTKQAVGIEFLIGNKAFEMVTAPFIRNLRKLGIDAKMRFVEENQYQTRVNNFEYDVIVGIFGQALIPGNELFAYFHSSQKDIKGGRNLIGIADDEVDILVKKISGAKSLKGLKQLTEKLDKVLLDGYYVIPQWHNNSYRILYRNVFGMPQEAPKYSLALDSWWAQ